MSVNIHDDCMVGGTLRRSGSAAETSSASRVSLSASSSPRKSAGAAAPPPVPPKRTNSFKASTKTDSTADDLVRNSPRRPIVQKKFTQLQQSQQKQPAKVGEVLREPSVSPFDPASLPFANENVGTIRHQIRSAEEIDNDNSSSTTCRVIGADKEDRLRTSASAGQNQGDVAWSSEASPDVGGHKGVRRLSRYFIILCVLC